MVGMCSKRLPAELISHDISVRLPHSLDVLGGRAVGASMTSMIILLSVPVLPTV